MSGIGVVLATFLAVVSVFAMWPVLGSASYGFAPASSTTYVVGFHGTNLSGRSWTVTLGSTTQTVNAQGGWIGFQEPNGSYAYRISGPSCLTASPSSGTVAVAGHNPPYVAVTFLANTTSTIGFEAVGLSGQNWSVVLNPSTGGSAVTVTSSGISGGRSGGTHLSARPLGCVWTPKNTFICPPLSSSPWCHRRPRPIWRTAPRSLGTPFLIECPWAVKAESSSVTLVGVPRERFPRAGCLGRRASSYS